MEVSMTRTWQKTPFY